MSQITAFLRCHEKIDNTYMPLIPFFFFFFHYFSVGFNIKMRLELLCFFVICNNENIFDYKI